ncbi:uncharacterized protein LOC132739189 [Ruditapes philippinarum]|uniref:uncharacterized protein LOC132739189 n=1 Tax=Ruditapes philippinarum TaxID=129788 RepID=UPI00295C31BE|nr:uncharacterized protein LOC132739189 [Ruditapes philippinarum]
MTTNAESQKQLGAILSSVSENLRVAVQKIENYREHQCLIEERLESFTQENREITDRLQKAEQCKERYRDERNKLMKEKFAKEIKERSDIQTEQKLRQDYNDLKMLYDAKEKEWEQNIKDSERSFHEFKRNQKQKLNEYVEKLKKQDGQTIQLQKTIEQNNCDIRKLRKQLEESKRQPSTTSDDTEPRVIGHKLTDNNPNIADLSDRDRPTKLAEKFAELYDNQWHDAFEELQKSFSSDEQIIEILLEILMDIYDFCKRRAREQLDDLQRVLLCSKSVERTQTSCPENVIKQLKDCRKTTSSMSFRSVYEVISSCYN